MPQADQRILFVFFGWHVVELLHPLQDLLGNGGIIVCGEFGDFPEYPVKMVDAGLLAIDQHPFRGDLIRGNAAA